MTTIFQKYDPAADAFINPCDYIKKIEGFPKLFVSTFSEKILDRFIEKNGAEKIAVLDSVNGEIPVYKTVYHNEQIGFYLSRVGAPACVCGFEEIIAMGAEKLILFGCCGVLDNIADNKIVIPAKAIRDEGTSYHYVPASTEIAMDDKVAEKMTACLEKHKYPYITGKTWTTDAIYRETANQIAERKKSGCLTVEMECAAMVAAAKFRAIPFGQFLYGADDLGGDTWQIRDLEEHGLSNAERYMRLACELVHAI